MLARLHFVMSDANLFTAFLTKFQSESTSIHLLFKDLAQVLQLLLQRFVKLDALKDKSAAQLLSVQCQKWTLYSLYVHDDVILHWYTHSLSTETYVCPINPIFSCDVLYFFTCVL